MSERKINPETAGIYRIQAMQETILKLLCESLAIQNKVEPSQVLAVALKDVDFLTKELITMHSHLSNEGENPSVN